MTWKENFKEGKELMLSTCSNNGQPNANIVISLGFDNDKLMIADCSMSTTIKNLKENQRACVIGGYFKILGTVEIFDSGDYFNKCVNIVESQDNTLKVKNAILIDVETIIDLDKQENI